MLEFSFFSIFYYGCDTFLFVELPLLRGKEVQSDSLHRSKVELMVLEVMVNIFLVPCKESCSGCARLSST